MTVDWPLGSVNGAPGMYRGLSPPRSCPTFESSSCGLLPRQLPPTSPFLFYSLWPQNLKKCYTSPFHLPFDGRKWPNVKESLVCFSCEICADTDAAWSRWGREFSDNCCNFFCGSESQHHRDGLEQHQIVPRWFIPRPPPQSGSKTKVKLVHASFIYLIFISVY